MEIAKVKNFNQYSSSSFLRKLPKSKILIQQVQRSIVCTNVEPRDFSRAPLLTEKPYF